jgi:hypothetical protein
LGLRGAVLFGQINQRGFAVTYVMGYAIGLIPLAAIGTPTISAPVLATILPTVLAAVLATILTIVLGVILPPRLLLGGHLAHRFGQKAGVVFGVLQEILGCHAVIRQLRIAGKRLIFLDNLLRGSAHFAFGARAVEDAVDNIA